MKFWLSKHFKQSVYGGAGENLSLGETSIKLIIISKDNYLKSLEIDGRAYYTLRNIYSYRTLHEGVAFELRTAPIPSQQHVPEKLF